MAGRPARVALLGGNDDLITVGEETKWLRSDSLQAHSNYKSGLEGAEQKTVSFFT